MNREKKIKVFLGSAYILIVFVFLLFFFNKFSFQDFSSYELIRENRNALEEIKNGNIFISSIIFLLGDRKSTRLNSSHSQQSRMPSSA